ncbi:helix-turn-helix domain-containing protein [Lachnospiraceae bacterium ZAX-1]
MAVGENVKRIRKEKRLTQKKLGKLSGIDEANIRKYEDENFLNKIAQSFPNAEIAKTDEKLIIEAIKLQTETQTRQGALRKNAFEKYDDMNYQEQSKAHAYINDLHDMPKYRKETGQ